MWRWKQEGSTCLIDQEADKYSPIMITLLMLKHEPCSCFSQVKYTKCVGKSICLYLYLSEKIITSSLKQNCQTDFISTITRFCNFLIFTKPFEREMGNNVKHHRKFDVCTFNCLDWDLARQQKTIYTNITLSKEQ